MMTKHTKLSLFTMLAAATAVPALAAADHGRNADRSTLIGEVGTHTHDAEDYVPVQHQRFDRIELRATGNSVRMDDLKIQFADGRIVDAGIDRTLRPGERVLVDVPSNQPIKMLVLEYDNPGRHWRAREDAKVEVRGLVSYDRDRDDRYESGSVRDRRIQPPPVIVRPVARPVVVRPVIRAGVRVRIGS